MSKGDFHNTSFDDGTIDKLHVYRQYLRAWIPVFLNSPFYDTIQIFDFFAGPGHDAAGNPGSPVIAKEELKAALEHSPTNKSIKLFLNELDHDKYLALKDISIEIEQTLNNGVQIFVTEKCFSEVFQEYTEIMHFKKTANLIFIDQFGIKEVTEPIFRKMASIPHTDFIFFCASSIVNRMKTHPDIKKYIPSLLDSDLAQMDGNNVHRILSKAYQRWIPENKFDRYFLGGYSIKKGSNVYGLVFGSGHPFGIDKFLRIAWQNGGGANFDVYNDNIDESQPSLFADFDVPTLIREFRNELESAILNQKLKTNVDIYIFTLKCGMIPEHAKETIRLMIQNNKLPEQRVPPISYDVWKNKKDNGIILKESDNTCM